MTIAAGGRPPKFDTKEAFNLYVEHGTLKRGLVAYNEKFGDTSSHQASFRRAVYNYIIWNQDETRAILLNGPKNDGKFKDDFAWLSQIVDWAFATFPQSPKGFVRWLMSEFNENLRDNYSFLYTYRYNATYGRPIVGVQI